VRAGAKIAAKIDTIHARRPSIVQRELLMTQITRSADPDMLRQSFQLSLKSMMLASLQVTFCQTLNFDFLVRKMLKLVDTCSDQPTASCKIMRCEMVGPFHFQYCCVVGFSVLTTRD
jgi:hypothetical protein